MKKRLFLLCLLIILTSMIYAEDMAIGGFGIGFWEDLRYNVIWEFQSTGIRLLAKNSKEVLYDFRDHKPRDVKVETNTSGVILTFANLDINWKYKIQKPISLNADLKATITFPNGSSVDFPLVFSNFKL